MKRNLRLVRSLDGAVPDARRVLLERDRVLALDEGRPILVIEGPSGYGKTSLAEMWLARQDKSSRRCWVSLDVASCDPVQYLEQVLRAVGAGDAGYGDAGLDDEAGRADRFDRLRSRLAEDSKAFCIVIDDAHLIANSVSRTYLERMLELACARLRFCLTLQPVPLDVGLGRLSTIGKVCWIDGRSLAWTRQEMATFAELRGQRLTAAQLDWLYRVTEGWPALTQLALSVPLDISSGPPGRIGDSGPLREYIHERFLLGLSEDERDVMWMLSCLGSVPVALLTELEPKPAKIEFALLHFRALGILQHHDPDDGTTVSLHALVRDGAFRLLERARSRGRLALIHEAASWYRRNANAVSAVRLALQGGQALAPCARDWLVEMSFETIFRNGHHQTLLDLVARWEQVTGQTDPDIDEAAAWALIFQREFTSAESRLSRLERIAQAPQQTRIALQRAVMAALRDDYALGGELALQWLDHHKNDHGFLTGVASTVFAFSQKRLGRFGEAHVALRAAMYCFNLTQSDYGIGWAHVVSAILLVQAGDYRAALAQAESGLSRSPESQGFGGLRTLLRALQAFVLYERNELDRVREVLGDSLPLLSDQGPVDAVGLGYIAAARARAAAGDFDTALDLLAEGEQIGLQRDFPRLTSILRAERALLLLRSGAPGQAQKIVDTLSGDGRARTALGLLRVRLALAGGEGPEARRMLGSIVERAREQGRQGRLCETLVQCALAEALCGNDAAAFLALGEALEIASIEGYVRIFIDEGNSLRELIARWSKDQRSPSRAAAALADRLLALGVDTAVQGSGETVTFNKRERQIVTLLGEGLSNAQLAKRCFISEGTVKWYLHTLYEKLGVGNRTALLCAVRNLGVKV